MCGEKVSVEINGFYRKDKEMNEQERRSVRLFLPLLWALHLSQANLLSSIVASTPTRFERHSNGVWREEEEEGFKKTIFFESRVPTSPFSSPPRE